MHHSCYFPVWFPFFGLYLHIGRCLLIYFFMPRKSLMITINGRGDRLWTASSSRCQIKAKSLDSLMLEWSLYRYVCFIRVIGFTYASTMSHRHTLSLITYRSCHILHSSTHIVLLSIQSHLAFCSYVPVCSCRTTFAIINYIGFYLAMYFSTCEDRILFAITCQL